MADRGGVGAHIEQVAGGDAVDDRQRLVSRLRGNGKRQNCQQNGNQMTNHAAF